jgi:hypothetical protein
LESISDVGVHGVSVISLAARDHVFARRLGRRNEFPSELGGAYRLFNGLKARWCYHSSISFKTASSPRTRRRYQLPDRDCEYRKILIERLPFVSQMFADVIAEPNGRRRLYQVGGPRTEPGGILEKRDADHRKTFRFASI